MLASYEYVVLNFETETSDPQFFLGDLVEYNGTAHVVSSYHRYLRMPSGQQKPYTVTVKLTPCVKCNQEIEKQ